MAPLLLPGMPFRASALHLAIGPKRVQTDVEPGESKVHGLGLGLGAENPEMGANTRSSQMSRHVRGSHLVQEPHPQLTVRPGAVFIDAKKEADHLELAPGREVHQSQGQAPISCHHSLSWSNSSLDLLPAELVSPDVAPLPLALEGRKKHIERTAIDIHKADVHLIATRRADARPSAFGLWVVRKRAVVHTRPPWPRSLLRE